MLFKTANTFGLRRNEAWMLDVADFGRNPQGAEYGVLYVCHGKAMRKRRSVLTVWPWYPEIIEQWVQQVRPQFATSVDSGASWPSERGQRIGFTQMNTRLAAYRDALGLDPALDFHSFRRSYVTYLIEDGLDARLV
ncbi:hypothetical protein GCM10010112_71470 [Actinoplanes lobatus]|uniref:Tyr recombinase domain-containing protein n=1 Tax=Actinoplanes lobatus TaxID=113568 RepID=A0ABQ4AEP7_9ACTN|nr:hypothetical protein GCM10010112_71470 [Actinoplanes lobatus]GIE39482.1 hypothetical protein Alo02nite_23800 [Actinoplanes lobatus]